MLMNSSIDFLEKKSKEMKLCAINTVLNAGRGHLGGSLSSADILVMLYYSGVMKYNIKDIKDPLRDRFIMSKGHSNNVFHAILADVGFFDKKELENYTKNNSILGGHCDFEVPGIDASTGALGHGLGIASGMALNAKLNNCDYKVFCVIGDGELQEGSMWEALLFSAHHKLNNLIIYLDYNKLSCENFVEENCSLEPIIDKFKSFNYEVFNVVGNNMEDLLLNTSRALSSTIKSPKILICNTTKGLGLMSLENTPKSHHVLPIKGEVEEIRMRLCQ